jgi:3-hydroxy-9,10-secoandrosta-1,3,5(10)-triene-9,17-dione monooxygenase reductase component
MPGSFTSKDLRAALGRFATGVTIVTCVDAAGQPVGLTANSFNALSLEPPLVLWSLRGASPSLAAFEVASHFSVNVLAESQIELSRRFASPVHDRFAGADWQPGLGGAPVLEGCAAVFQCSADKHLPMGDHMLFIGRVQLVADVALPPLVFQAGHYHQLGRTL